MRNWDNSIKGKIRELKSEGNSIRKIAKKLGISPTTSHKYSRNVRFSKSGKRRYFEITSGIKKPIKKQSKKLTKAKIRIISHLIFDGSVYLSNYHYNISYVNASGELVRQFSEDVLSTYGGLKPIFEKQPTFNRVKFCSKLAYQDLISFSNTFSSAKAAIPKKILNGSKLEIIELLRAFWEDEGSISKSGKLSADLKNLKLMTQISNIHKRIGLSHYISKYWKNGWCYKLGLNKTKDNIYLFRKYRLFGKAKVTKGGFIGWKKVDVLDYLFPAI